MTRKPFRSSWQTRGPLEIARERSDEREENDKGFYVRVRISGSMSRIVALPSDVTDTDARASFRNGVLEVTLKKTRDAKRSRIAIE